ncbi:MAG: ATP-dependent DNA helicase RecG [Peptococcaceae bacterium]|nr:ATP-dependent DNA helicase RecG [Peptococcaceae bacterium]
MIQSIHRAVRAEEKQGFINTGAMGSFSRFLLETLPSFSDFLSDELVMRLIRIIEDYNHSSPYRRRALLSQFKDLFQKAVGTSSPIIHHNLSKTGKDITQTEENVVVQANVAMSNHRKNPQPENRSMQYIKGVGPYRARQFENLGILTVEDLFRHYPRKYEMRSKKKIEDLQDGELATITGKVTSSQVSRGRIKVIKLNIEQDGRNIYAVWFNQIHIPKQFPAGTEVTVTGKVQWNKRIPEILASEIVKGDNNGPQEEIVPVYPETAGLHSKIIRGVIKNVLNQAENIFNEILPGESDLLGRRQAYQEIHFPTSLESIHKARERLVVEEVLFLQLALARLRSPSQAGWSPVMKDGGELIEKFVLSLPFQLTDAQKRVIQEIFNDLENGKKGMTRLVQGDVGSGKTVVAMAAILRAVGSGFQAAMMAPTEVLALQHYQSLENLFKPLGIEVVFLAGSQGKSEREQILGRIYSGKAHVVVGTHALIQETVRFNSLGLVVTDEQHRFGVRQRLLLEDKGENPHVLVMTATPIPRTLALTLYGDLQLSVLDQMPAGRKPIITRKISERNRPNLEKFLEKHMSLGRQIYVVCPLVEETEKSDLVSATQMAESLKERFCGRKIALLHGRMKSQEKESIMEGFRQGEIDMLVATTVVEVGVNVPNASVMVVEGAERFGLAQLHQLRGRVGRGREQSYCILVSNIQDSSRLNILCGTEDGFKIAEEDLKIRGPGELLGLRQHGVPELKLTDLSKDGVFVEKAYQILQKALDHPERYEKLYHEVDRLYPKDKVGLN